MPDALKSSWGERLGERKSRLPADSAALCADLSTRLTVPLPEAARFRVVGMGRSAKQFSDWIEREIKNQTWRERQNG